MGGDNEQDEPRQLVVKAPGRARRAKLTPAPHTDPSPEAPLESRNVRSAQDGGAASVAPGTPGENDDRLKRDRPPHW